MSNHFALRARLLWQPANCDGEYLRGRRAFPLKLPPTGPLNLVDTKFQELKAIKVPPSPCAHVPRPQWMSEESLRLIGAHSPASLTGGVGVVIGGGDLGGGRSVANK